MVEEITAILVKPTTSTGRMWADNSDDRVISKLGLTARGVGDTGDEVLWAASDDVHLEAAAADFAPVVRMREPNISGELTAEGLCVMKMYVKSYVYRLSGNLKSKTKLCF